MTLANSRKLIFLAALVLLALSVFYVVNFNPLLFTHNPFRAMGSFEYVRMGEELMDKGSYLKAISYYEKAYNSSPENQDIISGLIFAYSKYAYILAGSEKYDEAIKYLAKAYDVKESYATAQNLAIMCSKKAISLIKRGDLQGAMKLFDESKRIAGISYDSAKNLGMSLLNDGAMEFKEDRLDIALLCLKESLSIYRYSKTSELIAEIYYRRGDLRRAIFYWHLAESLDRENRAVSLKIKRAIKEMKLEDSKKIVELPHFELKYEKNLAIDPDIIASILEKAYFSVGKDIGYFPASRTKVFLYSREDFKNIFKMSDLVRAFYDGNIRMPMPEGKMAKEEFSTYIYHEYTHALLSAKTMNNCPVWFSEGVAMWMDITKTGRDIKNISFDPSFINNVTLESIDREFGKNEISSQRALYYILSYTIVAFIVDSWGIKGLQGILKRLSNGQHIINAIDDEFLLPEKEFEARWRSYLAYKNLLKKNIK